VEDASRVQKHIVLNEQVAPVVSAVEAGVVRIADIAVSPPQSTDKGIAGRNIPAGDQNTHESTYSR
jgi:hypothetical protein